MDLRCRIAAALRSGETTRATAAWIAARLWEKNDLTVRALTAELGEIGVAVCPDTVWRHLRREGLSFKKHADGERAGWRADGSQTGAVENASASPGSEPAGLCR
jgi:transposase